MKKNTTKLILRTFSDFSEASYNVCELTTFLNVNWSTIRLLV